mmetsp:Transcript_14470/g.24114  ORF Transcript_14470/g.24114 Transcript_14470/m.24114 type:complete len:408 (-) Transcript_14470:148-1371(-)
MAHAIALVLILLMASSSCSVPCLALAKDASAPQQQQEWKPRQPVKQQPLVIGYSHNPKGDKVLQAIGHGVSVVCWSFLHLDVDDQDPPNPIIRTDLDLSAIKAVRDAAGKDVLHMAAIGGWNGPHPPPGFSGAQWAQTFVDFNKQNGYIFDGLDWDLEGHDDRTAPTSAFTLDTLDVMADMSKALKEQHGYIVSMAPAESYLDVLAPDHQFSLDLNRFPRWWEKTDRQVVKVDTFSHAGRQCYAYVIHRAGINSFDWVSLQLYESFSRFAYETTVVAERDGENVISAQMDAMRRRAVAGFDGFDVELPNYGRVRIQVPPWKLVFGFANGWADGTKVVTVERRALNRLFVRLKTAGVMFWTIEEEGKNGLYLAKEVNEAIVRSKIDWHDLNDDVLPDEDEDEQPRDEL